MTDEMSIPFGKFAQRINSGEMYCGPRNGNSDDKAHPPIHPVKLPKRSTLDYDDWRVYEFIARHFLGSISKDATGFETVVKVQLGNEIFGT